VSRALSAGALSASSGQSPQQAPLRTLRLPLRTGAPSSRRSPRPHRGCCALRSSSAVAEDETERDVTERAERATCEASERVWGQEVPGLQPPAHLPRHVVQEVVRRLEAASQRRPLQRLSPHSPAALHLEIARGRRPRSAEELRVETRRAGGHVRQAQRRPRGALPPPTPRRRRGGEPARRCPRLAKGCASALCGDGSVVVMGGDDEDGGPVAAVERLLPGAGEGLCRTPPLR
jgi:hypothetical protein